MLQVIPNKKLILASQSPRRKELLAQIGLNFEVVVSGEPEVSDEQDPVLRARSFALLKAQAVAAKEKEAFVIGADTVVSLDGEIFEKPISRDDAFRMISALSGKTHLVTGGIAIFMPEYQPVVFSVQTAVTFRNLAASIINQYLDRSKYDDKAGAYGIQEEAQLFAAHINGSYTNIVGLDIVSISDKLLELGIIQWKE